MNKTLALIALLGLVSTPTFANEAPAKADKVVAKEDCSKKEGEAKKECEAKAEDAAPVEKK